MNKKPPFIGITMGDPAGIGPEIAIKAMISKELHCDSPIVIVGDLDVLEHVKKSLSLPVKLRGISSLSEFGPDLSMF